MKTLESLFGGRRSLFVRRSFWIGMVTLAFGALGAWSEVNADLTHGKRIITRSLHVSLHPTGANADVTLRELPDGTVWVEGSAASGQIILTAGDWQTSRGTIDVRNGVATATGTTAGTVWDFSASDGPQPTPAKVAVALKVVPTSDTWSIRDPYARSGLVVLGHDSQWDVANSRIAHVDVAGYEDLTLGGGALTLELNGQPFISGEGGLGDLKENYFHKVKVLK